jgi:hypothetical protein
VNKGVGFFGEIWEQNYKNKSKWVLNFMVDVLSFGDWIRIIIIGNEEMGWGDVNIDMVILNQNGENGIFLTPKRRKKGGCAR